MNLLAKKLDKRSVRRAVRSAKSSRLWLGTIAFSALMIGVAVSQAQVSATLGWDQDTGSVAGYRVYQGTSSRVYTTSIDASKNLQIQMNGLTAGVTYYFAVCAYTSAGV